MVSDEDGAAGPGVTGQAAYLLLPVLLLVLLPILPATWTASASADDDPAPKAAPAGEDEAPGADAAADADAADETTEPKEGPPQTALAFEGSALVETVGSLGQENFRFRLVIKNSSDAPITIEKANLLLAHLGGWLSPLDPDSMDGSFFRGPLPVEAGSEKPHAAGGRYVSITPATHALLTIQADDGRALLPIPILRTGFEGPKEYTPTYPLGIGVVGPLHVLPFSDGEDAVLLVGQHQVLGGGEPTAVKTSIQIGSDEGAGAPIEWEGLDAQGDLTALWPFVRRIPVFPGFKSGYLRISTSATIDGREETVIGTWPVTNLEPLAIRAPLTGTWQLSNGPGGTDMTRLGAQTQDRYAYDMVVLKDGRTHSGDPHLNSSYYAWNRDIRAVADGEIVDICDHEPDNPGYRGALTQCYNNRVVIKHPGPQPGEFYYSAYLHIQKGSKAQGLTIESKVRAGQLIAKVGNSGNSSEPHLHFQVFRLDATGRIRGVPVSFTNAFHGATDTDPVAGVPLSGQTYRFRSD